MSGVGLNTRGLDAMNLRRRRIVSARRIALRCFALLGLLLVCQMSIGVASAAAPAVGRGSLTCEGGSAGLQQLCLMASADRDPNIALLVPSENVLEAAWHLYVQTHLEQRRPPTLPELADRLLVRTRDVRGYVDA